MENQDGTSVSTEPQVTPPPKQNKLVTFVSDPFTTAQAGVQKLLKLNSHALIGVSIAIIVVGVVFFAAIFAAIIATFAFIIRHNTDIASLPASLSYVSSWNDVSVYLTWILSAIFMIVCLALLSALPVKLGLASADGQTVTTKMVFAKAFMRIPALIGQAALILLALIVAVLIFGLLFKLLGAFTIVLVILAGIGILYLAFRLALSAYALIDENLGPIAGFKRSWSLTNNHVLEIVGIGSVVGSVGLIPEAVFGLLARLTGSNPIVMIFSGLVSLVVSVIMTAAVAERFNQLRSLHDNSAPLTKPNNRNWIAILICIVLSIIVPKIGPASQNPFTNLMQQYQTQQAPTDQQPLIQDNSGSSSTDPSQSY